MSPQPSQRRADIDWIRVAAFGVLILYHVGLVYAPWDWHIHSAHTFEILRYAALVTNPWRLTLLFLVSGVALRLMSRRRAPTQVLSARLARLGPPFLFGVLVLVPPQAWIEAVDKGSWSQGLSAWWLAEFSGQGLADGIPLNHLWFVLYIGVYSLLAIALSAWPTALDRLEAAAAWLLRGWHLLVLPMVYLVIVRQQFFATYGLTNHLTTDWYNHAMSGAVFAFGFLLALRDAVWRDLERLRWAFLAIVAVALPILIAIEADPRIPVADGWPRNIAFAVDQWAMIGAVLGFASRHIRAADGPVLRYLTDAVFPCYLAHQTLLVIGAHLLKPLTLPPLLESGLLVLVTLGGSLAVYEAVRRMGPIRLLWGLKPEPLSASAGTSP